jgi:hypothetical protein
MASPQKNNPTTTTTDDGSSCVICFEHIELDNKAVIKNCAHAFCFICIKSWMDTTITCPLCKQTIDVLQHSFTSEESFQEEKVEAPNLRNDSSGGGQSNVEDQLQCLDHSFFIGEVQRLLNDAERRHRQLWQEAQSHRGLATWEQQQLGAVESVIAELRNHKRKLQALLQFDPHATLQDLYRLQDLLQASWRGLPTVTYARARSPVRYSADDADAAADWSDEDDYAEDLSYMSIGKGGKKAIQQRQSKSKTRTPASKIGNSRNRKGIAN